MKKLAVFFPGIGYTLDKPLMYYSRRLAVDAGYEILILPYFGFPQNSRGDRNKMTESCKLALAQATEMLSGTELSEYDSILFVGKSIGTVVAAEIASNSSVLDRIHFVLYTPLEETFAFSANNAIVFTGDADPWVESGTVPALCKKQGIPCHVIRDANHSLETGHVLKDIEIMKKIMRKTRNFIRKL